MTDQEKGEQENDDSGILPFNAAPTRLDAWLAGQKPSYSRNRWQELIRAGCVQVNHRPRKPNYILQKGDTIRFHLPPEKPDQVVAEDIQLDIIHEDDDLIVVNKPPGMVTHPAPGHARGTLVNALLHHCPTLREMDSVQRPGIVHRLDKDTSGVMIAAKNERTRERLALEFKEHRVHKAYGAIVWGCPEPPAGTVETRIGRNPRNRKKMTAEPEHGKEAVTRYTIVEAFDIASLLNVVIETGRTHQIRVHMSHIGHPVIGDRQYGRARQHQLPIEVARQMLHAARLELTHPATGQPLEFEAPLPEDMTDLIRALRM